MHHFHHRSNSILFFLKSTPTLDTDWPSLYTVLLPKLPSYLLTEYLIYHHDVPHKIFLIKELISQQMKCENRPMLMEFTGLVMFHPHLKEAELIEQQRSLLKIQLQCQLGGKTWQSWGKVLQEAVYGLNRHPICGGFFSPTAQNQEVGRQHHHSPLLLITH